MTNKTALIQEAAARLRNASASGKTCAPIRDLIGIEDVSTAYAIQRVNNQIRMDAGAKVVGYKIGLTSEAVQQQLGVDQPDYGLLFDDKQVIDAGSLPISEVMQPKVEAEIAFVLGSELKDPELTMDDLIAAIDHAVIALEIVGSRIAAWDIKITDTIADNASAAHFAVGKAAVSLSELDLVNCQMRMNINGVEVSRGQGSACLGNPLNAALWLAQQMASLGEPLQPGHLLLSGAVGPMANVAAGDEVVASIEGLGTVAVSFL